MKVQLLPGRELSDDLSAEWIRIQEGDSTLASPFLRPEYFAAVAAVKRDVTLGILEEEGRPVGFFPFQRSRLRTAIPAGAPLCEYQAIIGGSAELSPRALVSGCGLVAWEFDHLLASQTAFAPFHLEVEESPVIDLADGAQGYREALAVKGSSLFKQGERKGRKLEREVGPLRFEPRVTDKAVLRQLLEWKSAQSRRTGIFDVFRFEWPHRLVERILETQEPGFAGMLSALYAGDELVAAHLGMRSNGVWHWWFPTYDVRFARYSPGLVLLLRMVGASEDLGIRRLDFGRGDESYKLRASTGSTRIARGRVECPSLITTVRQTRRRTMSFLRGSSLARPAEACARLVRRGENWLRSR
jgi:CelD/BcsL family acetyltransferase involved in cellulose biosynthesis